MSTLSQAPTPKEKKKQTKEKNLHPTEKKKNPQGIKPKIYYSEINFVE